MFDIQPNSHVTISLKEIISASNLMFLLYSGGKTTISLLFLVLFILLPVADVLDGDQGHLVSVPETSMYVV